MYCKLLRKKDFYSREFIFSPITSRLSVRAPRTSWVLFSITSDKRCVDLFVNYSKKILFSEGIITYFSSIYYKARVGSSVGNEKNESSPRYFLLGFSKLMKLSIDW